MLTPSQVSDIKHKDPDAFNLFRLITDAINNFGLQMGVDPKPASQVEAAVALPPPRAPKSITVTVVAPVVFVQIEPSPEATASAFYFVERSLSNQFTDVLLYTLGHSLQVAIPELPGTTYWRAFAKYQMSGRSPLVAFPSAVVVV